MLQDGCRTFMTDELKQKGSKIQTRGQTRTQRDAGIDFIYLFVRFGRGCLIIVFRDVQQLYDVVRQSIDVCIYEAQ